MKEKRRAHPLAIWIELQIGPRDGQRLSRREPITVREAAARLAQDAGRDQTRCQLQLQNMLTLMSKPAGERGGNSERAFLAFKLHRFISGAGFVYATLKGSGQRRITLEGQRFDPSDPDARLYCVFRGKRAAFPEGSRTVFRAEAEHHRSVATLAF